LIYGHFIGIAADDDKRSVGDIALLLRRRVGTHLPDSDLLHD